MRTTSTSKTVKAPRTLTNEAPVNQAKIDQMKRRTGSGAATQQPAQQPQQTAQPVQQPQQTAQPQQPAQQPQQSQQPRVAPAQSSKTAGFMAGVLRGMGAGDTANAVSANAGANAAGGVPAADPEWDSDYGDEDDDELDSGTQSQQGTASPLSDPAAIQASWEAYKKSNPVPSDVEALRTAIKNMLFNMGSTKVDASTVESFKKKVLANRKITNEDLRRLPMARRRLYEGKSGSALRTTIIAESLGKALLEFTLTSDQIQGIFPAAEKGMDELSQQGIANNRTTIGKGKDIYDKVEKFVDDLVASVQKTKFVGDFDQKSQEALMQLDANGQQVLKPWIAKYRQFAQEHPKLQNLFYTVLVSAGGLAIGLGAGPGAIILYPLLNGLTKCLDRYLQGDKASSAVGKGVATGLKTALMGWLTREVRELISNPPPEQSDAVIKQRPLPPPPPLPVAPNIHHVVSGDNLSTIAQQNNVSVEQLIAANKDVLTQAGFDQANPNNLPLNIDLKMPAPTGAGTYANNVGLQGTTTPAVAIGDMPPSFNPKLDKQSYINPNRALSEATIGAIFYRIELRQRAHQMVTEGPAWDSIKKTVGGAAKGVADWGEKKLKDAGRHMTTIVTANKLKSAWNKAGQPTDSKEFIEFLVKAGVQRPLAEKLVGQYGSDQDQQQQGGGTATSGDLFGNPKGLEQAWQQYKAQGGKFTPQLKAAFKAIWLDPWWSSVISTSKDGGTQQPTQMADPNAAQAPAPQSVNPMANQDPNAAFQQPAQPYQKKQFNFNSKVNKGKVLAESAFEALLFGKVPMNESTVLKTVLLNNKVAKIAAITEVKKMAASKRRRDR